MRDPDFADTVTAPGGEDGREPMLTPE